MRIGDLLIFHITTNTTAMHTLSNVLGSEDVSPPRITEEWNHFVKVVPHIMFVFIDNI